MAKENPPKPESVIVSAAQMVTDPAGRSMRILKEAQATDLAQKLGLSMAQVYRQALAAGIWPYRYIRNHGSLSLKDQACLAQSRVAVVGCGGLGGNVLHLLARIGLGTLILIDHDRFDETNLNRQLVSRNTNLGQPKAEAAQTMVAEINPGVHCRVHTRRLSKTNAESLLENSQVVVDALDNVAGRLVMAQACRKLGIPLVHGAIAGWGGQAMTIFPDDTGLETLYTTPDKADPTLRPEAVLGVPVLMPTMIGTLQAAEVLKIILKRGTPLRNRLLHIDLESALFDFFSF